MNNYLFDELLNFTVKFDKERLGFKAHRIYVRCLRKKHFTIADRIKKKYGRLFPQSDMAVAFGWMLLAQSEDNKKP